MSVREHPWADLNALAALEEPTPAETAAEEREKRELRDEEP